MDRQDGEGDGIHDGQPRADGSKEAALDVTILMAYRP